MRRCPLLLALTLACCVHCAVVSVAGVNAQGGMRTAAAWLPIPEALQARVEGQVSDLPWSLVVVYSQAHRRAADAPCANGASDVVWWAEADATPTYTLWVVQCDESRRVLQRSFTSPSPRPRDRSATMEALSLALRGVLQAIAAGEEDTVFTADVVPVVEVKVPEPPDGPDAQSVEGGATEQPPPAEEEGSPSSSAAATLADTEGANPHPSLRVALLAAVAMDGLPSPGVYGGAIDLVAWLTQGVALSLVVEANLQRDVILTDVQVSLQRNLALAGIMGRIWGADGVTPQLWIGLHGGVAWVRRSTGDVSAGLLATSPSEKQHWLPTTAAMVTGHWPLWVAQRMSLQVVLQAGVQYWPEQLLLRADGADADAGVDDQRQWQVQPLLRVGAAITF